MYKQSVDLNSSIRTTTPEHNKPAVDDVRNVFQPMTIWHSSVARRITNATQIKRGVTFNIVYTYHHAYK